MENIIQMLIPLAVIILTFVLGQLAPAESTRENGKTKGGECDTRGRCHTTAFYGKFSV